jgi:hypothetical protein
MSKIEKLGSELNTRSQEKMSAKYVNKFKCFWAWQDDQEEAWLSQMAVQGFHLDKPVFPCVYRFKVAQPADVTYRLDYPALKTKDRESYLQLFADAGWEHTGDMGGWVYFRKEKVQGEMDEIFTNVESKIQKYQRLVTYLAIFLPILMVLSPDPDKPYFGVFGPVIFGLYLALILLWAIAIIMLWRRIVELKKSEKE